MVSTVSLKLKNPSFMMYLYLGLSLYYLFDVLSLYFNFHLTGLDSIF